MLPQNYKHPTSLFKKWGVNIKVHVSLFLFTHYFYPFLKRDLIILVIYITNLYLFIFVYLKIHIINRDLLE